MKIIDVNKENGNLIVEMNQGEYSRIIIALDKVFPPLIVAKTSFSEDDFKKLKNELVVADDEIK